MAKKKTPTAQERLQKAVADQALLESELQLLMLPALWPFVETLCRTHLLANKNDQPSRELVAQFALTCRQEALGRFGHDTLETFALARLLRDGTGRWVAKAPQVDAITHINRYPHKAHRLNSDQEGAANSIREVWEAFGKFLEITGRGIGGGGSSRGSALGPMDVMGQILYEHHRDVFKPWQALASRVIVERRTVSGIQLSIAAVTFKVLVEDIYPETLDRNFALVSGTTLRALKFGLNCYYDPTKLAAWGKPPPSPPANAPGKGSNPSQGGQTGEPGAHAAEAPPKPPGGLWQPPALTLPPGGKVKLGPRRKK